MAQDLVERIKILRDSSDVLAKIAAEKKAEDELAEVRKKHGAAGVKILKETIRQQDQAAKGPSEWTKALQANAAAQAEATQALNDFRGKVNLGAESLGKMGSALSMVDPQLAAIAQGVQKVTGLVSAGASGAQLFGNAIKGALTFAGGPVAIAAAAATAAVAFAYDEYAESAKAAEEAEKAAKEETEKATAAHEALTKAIRDQRIEQDRLAGRITDTEAKLKGASNTMKDEYGPRLEAAKKKLDEARAAQEEWRRSMGPMDGALETDKVKLEQLTAATGEAAVEYSNLTTEYKKSLRQQKEIIVTTDKQAAAKEAATEKTKSGTKATKDAEKAAKDLLEVERALDETERIAAANREQMAQEDDARNKAAVQAAIDAENRKLEAANKRAQAIMDLEASIRADQERTNAQARAGAEDLIGTFSDAADAIASATEDSGGQAAQSAFLASQALGYTQAAIAALKTGGEVAAQLAPVLGPAAIPAGVAAGAAAGVAFAAPIAAMQPPAFDDSPGVMRVGPSGRQNVNLKEGDLWLAAQSMDGLTAQMGAYLSAQQGIQSRRPRRSRLRDRLAMNPLQVLGIDLPRAIRGGGR